MSQNKLPKDWKWAKIIEISDINPKLPRKDEIEKELEIQFIPMKLVEATINKIHLSETRKFEDVLKGSYTPFIDRDIIFAKVTPCMENGKIAIVNNLKNGIGFGSSEFHVLRAKAEILNKYLFHYIIQDKFRIEAANSMTGAVGLRRVPKQFIENSQIPLPPLATQKLIVSTIEELFSELNRGIEDLKTALQQLKTYRQSVLKYAFEGKLTNEKVKKGVMPKGWELKTLKEIFKVSSGKGIKINQLKGGNHAVYGGNGLNGYHSEYFIEEPVLIIGRVGVKCGVTHITKPKSWVSDNALIVKSIIKDFDIKFFKLKLEFENLNKLSVSTAQPVISGNSIYSVSIELPPIKEQHRIVQEIESRLSVADKMEEIIVQSLLQAEALRQSILKKAFSGELV